MGLLVIGYPSQRRRRKRFSFTDPTAAFSSFKEVTITIGERNGKLLRLHFPRKPIMMQPAVKFNSGVSTPIGSPGSAASGRIMIQKANIFGTWNVRGLNQPGKLNQIENEMDKCNISILGLSETHWRDSGHFTSAAQNTVMCSGNGLNSRNGVAVIVSKSWSKSVIEYKPISDRIIVVKFNSAPCKINFVQVYAPTSTADEEEIDEFYDQLAEVTNQLPKKEITLIQGDFNAKVGVDCTESEVAGIFGLGTRNESGEKLIQFCQGSEMVIANTLFKQHPRRLYTWTSPNGEYRNQIDYSLIQSRWRSSIGNVKTRPGADCGTDHQLLVSKFRIHLKSVKQKNQINTRIRGKAEWNKFENILQNKLGKQSSSTWNDLQQMFKESKDEVIKSRTTQSKKNCWFSTETVELIEKRKEQKLRGLQCTPAYNDLSAQIRREIRRDKNKVISETCERIEEYADKNHSSELFQEIKKLTGKFKLKTWAIEDEHGVMQSNPSMVLECWRNYCERLYSDPNPTPTQIQSPVEQEPNILIGEIREAIKKLRNNKSPGSDGVTAEMLKLSGEKGVKILWELCNQVWNTGTWPPEWAESIFIPLHKKGRTENCSNYRTISLISHASKVMLCVIHTRLRNYLDSQIPPEQAGFAKGRGTREQILNIRQLIEKHREFRQPLILCFIDYNKAFDCVQWTKLWDVLHEMGVPDHLISLIQSLYEASSATVRCHNTESKHFQPKKGVRQGCILSPVLFNIYSEAILRKALENWDGGASIGGVKVNNLRFADDTTLCANSEEEMSRLLKKVEEESEKFGLTINKSKTKVMIVDRDNAIPPTNILDGFEKVEEFIYLGSLVQADGGGHKEIRRRIALGREAVSKLTPIWKDHNISRNNKLRLLKTLAFSVMLYGAETWTLRKADIKRIDAFEMWSYRRMLRISWMERRTNASILEKLNIQKRLSEVCKQRILKFFGHLMRRDGHSLEKQIIQGKIEGRRGQGRPGMRWIDQCQTFTGLSLENAVRLTEDRLKWKETVESISGIT